MVKSSLPLHVPHELLPCLDLRHIRPPFSVVICLDDGEVYDSLTEEPIGNLFDL
jgi:hypothetical protein